MTKRLKSHRDVTSSRPVSRHSEQVARKWLLLLGGFSSLDATVLRSLSGFDPTGKEKGKEEKGKEEKDKEEKGKK